MPEIEYSAEDSSAVLDIYLAGSGDQFVNMRALREAVRALREDSRRLDWVEAEVNRMGAVRIEAWAASSALGVEMGDSLREAIDAARGEDAKV